MDDWLYRSVPLPADAGEASPVDVFRNGGKHFRVYPQVSHCFKLALLHRHGLGGEAFAHTLGFYSALFRVDSTSAVIASLPADGDGGVVAS